LPKQKTDFFQDSVEHFPPKFFARSEEARAAREFLSPSTPFLPAPPERLGILRNAAGVSLKKGSRIFNYSPPNRILQVFFCGQRSLLAAPCGAARKELSGKIKRRDEIPRRHFFRNEAVRHNEVMDKSF